MGAIARVEVRARDTIRAGVGVALPSVGRAPVSSSLPMGRGFSERLRQAQGPAIEKDGELEKITQSLLFFF